MTPTRPSHSSMIFRDLPGCPSAAGGIVRSLPLCTWRRSGQMPLGSGSEDEAIRDVRWVLISDPCPQKRQTREAPREHRGEGPWRLDLGAHELRTPTEELGGRESGQILPPISEADVTVFLLKHPSFGWEEGGREGPLPSRGRHPAPWKIPEQPCSRCPTWVNYSRHTELTGSPRVPHLFLAFQGRPSRSPGPQTWTPRASRAQPCAEGQLWPEHGTIASIHPTQQHATMAGLWGIFWVECKVLLQWAACFCRCGAFS